jgi:hypothetical protein
MQAEERDPACALKEATPYAARHPGAVLAGEGQEPWWAEVGMMEAEEAEQWHTSKPR